MSERFDEALRELGEHASHRHEAAQADWAESMVARVQRGRRVRSAGLAGGLVAVVVAVAVGGAALANRPAPLPPATTGTSVVSSPTDSPSPAEQTPPESAAPTGGGLAVVGGWSDLGVAPATFGDAAVTDAVLWQGQTVAVGCDAQASGSGSGVSTDAPIWVGGHGGWTRSGPVPAPLSGEWVTCLTDLVASPHGLFAVAGNALLRSDDGVTWSTVELLPTNGGRPNGSYVAVVVSGARVTVLTLRASLAESEIATLWTTTDGMSWDEVGAGVAHDEAGVGDNPAVVFDNGGPASMVALGDTWVAVGASPGGQFVPTAAAWTSTDTLTWTPAAVEDAADCYLTDVVVAPPGLVGAGWCATTGAPAVWTSVDGTSWQTVAAPEALGPASTGFTEVTAITAVGDALVIAGADHGDGAETTASRVQWIGTPEAGWERADDVAAPFHVVDGLGFWPAGGAISGADVSSSRVLGRESS